jgi:hypothetical protein
MLANGIYSGLQKIAGADAGNLDGILECQENSLAGALFGGECEQVFSVVEDLALRDFVR